MTDTDKPKLNPDENAALALFFEAARDVPGTSPDDDLMARVLADADAVQPISAPIRSANATVTASPARPSLLAILGGWRGAAGLSAATLAGIWIGISPPQPLASTAQTVLGTSTIYVIDLDPTAAYLGGEGAL